MRTPPPGGRPHGLSLTPKSGFTFTDIVSDQMNVAGFHAHDDGVPDEVKHKPLEEKPVEKRSYKVTSKRRPPIETQMLGIRMVHEWS